MQFWVKVASWDCGDLPVVFNHLFQGPLGEAILSEADHFPDVVAQVVDGLLLLFFLGVGPLLEPFKLSSHYVYDFMQFTLLMDDA